MSFIPSPADLFRTVFPLRHARVHEVSGPGSVGFAAVLAGSLGGDVLWVSQGRGDPLNPNGLSAFCDPGCIVVADCRNQTDALAVTEEALRSGAVSLVVTAISGPLSLTAGRRLQLAAKAGQGVGLCLIPEGMGSNAAETRWHCVPVFDADDTGADDIGDSTLMRWRLTKNKSGTNGTWDVRWMQQTHHLHVVSASGE